MNAAAPLKLHEIQPRAMSLISSGASLLQGMGHCCLAGVLIGCRGRVSVAAGPFGAPWIAKAAQYPI